MRIDGLVEKELTFAIDDLICMMPLEERIYRHRCVETWAMVVPWTGFPLAEIVRLARPLGSAKFLKLEGSCSRRRRPIRGLLVSLAPS
ncbi:MAG: molybdopterin-dependent oxidoreductase [Hyphomicrobiales bacterium]